MHITKNLEFAGTILSMLVKIESVYIDFDNLEVSIRLKRYLNEQAMLEGNTVDGGRPYFVEIRDKVVVRSYIEQTPQSNIMDTLYQFLMLPGQYLEGGNVIPD